MLYGRWDVVLGESNGEGEGEGELRLNGWWLPDGVDRYVCFNVSWVFVW